MSGFGLSVLVEENELNEDATETFKNLSSFRLSSKEVVSDSSSIDDTDIKSNHSHNHEHESLLPPLPTERSSIELNKNDSPSISQESHHSETNKTTFEMDNSKIISDHEQFEMLSDSRRSSNFSDYFNEMSYSTDLSQQSSTTYQASVDDTTTRSRSNSLHLRKLKDGIKRLSLNTHKINLSYSRNNSNDETNSNSNFFCDELNENNLDNNNNNNNNNTEIINKKPSGSISNSTYRSFSNSSSTPITPPLTSPIIILTEKFDDKEDSQLNRLDQNYINFNSNLISDISLENNENLSIDLINELKTPEELTNYLIYLNNEKTSILEGFKLTENRLIESGWFSSNDLNELNLKKNNYEKKINDKIFKIEVKLSHLEKISYSAPVQPKGQLMENSLNSSTVSLRNLEAKFN